MTLTPEDQQKLLETEARHLSINRLERRYDQACSRGDGENSEAGRLVVNTLVSTVTKKIDEFIGDSKTGKAGRRSAMATYLINCPLNSEEIAWLTLRGFMNRAVRYQKSDRTQPTDCTFSNSISMRLVDEMFLRGVHSDDPKLLKKWQTECDQRALSREAAREFMRRQARNLEMTWTYIDPQGNEWDGDVQLKLGRVLLELLLTSTNLGYLKTVRLNKHNSKKVVFVTDEFLDFIEKAKELLLDKAPFYLPMVVPPKDWTTESGLYGGGYLTKDSMPYPLVKRAKSEWLDEIIDNGPDVLLNAMNAIQKTPWRINTKVLDALQTIYSTDKGMAGLPTASREEIPPPPEEFDADYRRVCWGIHERNRRSLTQRLFVTQVLWLAEKFSQYDRIYFPHDLDSRGRAYPKPAFMNPQGPDYVKGLLEFADGKPLATESAAAWLAVHVANCWGEDKIALDDRIAWTQGHEELITSVAENPLDDLRWTQADEPFQFLSACMSWKGYLDEGLDYVCHTPIAVDATCSGLQHYAAMLRDPVGGRAVNLTGDPVRQDVYQDVAEVTKKLLEADLGTDNDGLARAWLEFGVDRKITKRSVMVVPYAATYIACCNYTREAVKERLEKGEEMPWHGEENPFIAYGAKKIWEAIAQTVVAASEAMRWISAAARDYAREGNHDLRWGTPSGMVVHLRKPNLKQWRMDTILDGSRIQMKAKREEINLNPSKMASSTPPSFVHSLDAAHMCLAIDASTFAGLEHFGVIHDSFSTHAVDMEVFSQAIRDTFHEMYSQDILDGFRQCIQEGLQEPLPALPEKGDLDLDEVLTSVFFFS